VNCKRKSRRRFFLLVRSRTPPISSEFLGGFEHLKPPLCTPLHTHTYTHTHTHTHTARAHTHTRTHAHAPKSTSMRTCTKYVQEVRLRKQYKLSEKSLLGYRNYCTEVSLHYGMIADHVDPFARSRGTSLNIPPALNSFSSISQPFTNSRFRFVFTA